MPNFGPASLSTCHQRDFDCRTHTHVTTQALNFNLDLVSTLFNRTWTYIFPPGWRRSEHPTSPGSFSTCDSTLSTWRHQDARASMPNLKTWGLLCSLVSSPFSCSLCLRKQGALVFEQTRHPVFQIFGTMNALFGQLTAHQREISSSTLVYQCGRLAPRL